MASQFNATPKAAGSSALVDLLLHPSFDPSNLDEQKETLHADGGKCRVNDARQRRRKRHGSQPENGGEQEKHGRATGKVAETLFRHKRN